jgi:hypothetical protein
MFLVTLISGVFQAWVLVLYIDSAIYGNWTNFARLFSVEAPASGPVVYCFGRCAAKLPFAAGWVSIASFLLGLVFLAYTWWHPKVPHLGEGVGGP